MSCISLHSNDTYCFFQKYIIKNIIIQVVMSRFVTNTFLCRFSRITFSTTTKMFCSRFDDNRLFLSEGDFSGHLFSLRGKILAMERSKKVDGGKIFWRLNGEEVLYGLTEFQSVISERMRSVSSQRIYN